MASFSSMAAAARSGATIGGVYLLPNTGERVAPGAAVSFRGALPSMVPEGTKGLFQQTPANVRFCYLTVSLKDAKALGLVDAKVQEEGTKGFLPAPTGTFCSSGDAQDALGLVTLPMPEEGTKGFLPAPAGIFCSSGDAQDSAAVRLLRLAVLEGTEALLSAPAAITHSSGNSQSSAELCYLDIAGGLLALAEGSKAGFGRQLCTPVARCSGSSASAAITGGRGLLSVPVPKEICWGLLPAANRHVLVGRCYASSNAAGESFVPSDENFKPNMDKLSRDVNSSALVGYPSIMKELEDSARIALCVVESFAPMATDFMCNYVKMEYRSIHYDLSDLMLTRAYEVATKLEVVRSEATEGYIREVSLVAAIVQVREFGRAFDPLPTTPYAGTAAKAEDKFEHFKLLVAEFHTVTLALETGFQELRKNMEA